MQTSHRKLEDLWDESLSNIHHIFVESHTYKYQEMMEFYKPLDFSQIEGTPHDIPNDVIKKLPIFQGNNAIAAKSHLRNFEKHLVSYCNDASHNHKYVKMKLFALS